jgi:hypothetical protein
MANEVLRLFVSAIRGEAIELMNENIKRFSALCDEIQLRKLSQCVIPFKDMSAYLLTRLEDHFARLECQNWSTLQEIHSRGTNNQDFAGELFIQ